MNISVTGREDPMWATTRKKEAEVNLSSRMSLFAPIVPADRLNPTYRAVLESPGYASARQMIDEIFSTFVDRDGNFAEQFQTTGFDTRIWELYLSAYLRESRLEIDWNHDVPDFLAYNDLGRFCIEAVTANPTLGRRPPMKLLEHLAQVGPEELKRMIIHDYPVKWETVLVPKLERRYWELPQAEGLPLVFAVEDFHEAISLLLSDAALTHYLYGVTYGWEWDEAGNLVVYPVPIGEHKAGRRVVPSGFFALPGAEHVSGVLFSNSGTISKFGRMGYLHGYVEEGVTIVRVGTRYNRDPNAAHPLPFAYRVGDVEFPETWGQGLSFFHNPRALHPLSQAFLPGIAHHWLNGEGLLCGSIPEFHPITSITHFLVSQRQTGEPSAPP